MAGIPDRVIEDVRDRADMVQVVGRYVSLKKSGNRYWGLCPFHGEKTPSFTVHPEKQIFHCFGCGVGGDVFTFRMRHDGLEFVDAVKALADEFGVPMPEAGDSRSGSAAPLYRINETALDFFRDTLRGAEGRVAREYLDTRGIPQDLRDRFQLGFAPPRWDGLIQHLRSENEPAEIAERAGLIAPRQNEDGHYDRFRGRVVFPIREPSGRLVGFGGRALGDDTPKYLNSPESPVYQKSRALFGLQLALDGMRERERVIVVEGYFDLLALHRAGLPEAVAPCGTALTRAQAARLRRYVPEVVLLFDGDEAGRSAAERALPALLAEGLRVRAAFLPAGADPDTLLAEQGAAALREVVDAAVPLIEYLVDRAIERNPPTHGAWGAADAVSELRPVLAAVTDPIERATRLRDLAARLDLPLPALEQALRGDARRPEPREPEGAPTTEAPAALPPLDPISDVLVAAIAAHPELGAILADFDPQTLPEGPGRVLVSALARAGEQHGGRAVAHLLSPHASELPAELRPLLSRVAARPDPLDPPAAEKAVRDCLAQLALRALHAESLRISRRLESCTDPSELRSLLERKQRLLSERSELWSRVQQV